MEEQSLGCRFWERSESDGGKEGTVGHLPTAPNPKMAKPTTAKGRPSQTKQQQEREGSGGGRTCTAAAASAAATIRGNPPPPPAAVWLPIPRRGRAELPPRACACGAASCQPAPDSSSGLVEEPKAVASTPASSDKSGRWQGRSGEQREIVGRGDWCCVRAARRGRNGARTGGPRSTEASGERWGRGRSREAPLMGRGTH